MDEYLDALLQEEINEIDAELHAEEHKQGVFQAVPGHCTECDRIVRNQERLAEIANCKHESSDELTEFFADQYNAKKYCPECGGFFN